MHSQLYGSSQLPRLTATQILSNGTAGNRLSAGIRADGNSEVLLRGANISQNNGPGILALVNSSVNFAGGTLNGNTGVITCDSTSTMVSDLDASASDPASGFAAGISSVRLFRNRNCGGDKPCPARECAIADAIENAKRILEKD